MASVGTLTKKMGAQMNAKQYLKSICLLDIKVSQKRRELERLRLDYGLSGVDYSKDHVQGSSSSEASFVRLAERAAELEQQIAETITELIDKRNEAIASIHKLESSQHIDLLYKRYVEYKSLEQIAREMGYSYIHIARLHGQALQEFERACL